MKIVFLGTGTSTGNPEIGCQCEVCTSKDPRDWRLRASILVETEGKRILIDCGPDFRWQMITNKIYYFDAVLVTHEHYDHVGGLDDLRPFGRYKDVDIYAEDNVVEAIKTRIPYVFREHKYPGVPNLVLHTIGTKPFEAAGVMIDQQIRVAAVEPFQKFIQPQHIPVQNRTAAMHVPCGGPDVADAPVHIPF